MSRQYTDSEVLKLDRRLCCVIATLDALKEQIEIGAIFPRVDSYDDLPQAADFPGGYFHVENSQGTK
jgi:hypothetical protein